MLFSAENYNSALMNKMLITLSKSFELNVTAKVLVFSFFLFGSSPPVFPSLLLYGIIIAFSISFFITLKSVMKKSEITRSTLLRVNEFPELQLYFTTGIVWRTSAIGKAPLNQVIFHVFMFKWGENAFTKHVVIYSSSFLTNNT